MDWQEQSRINYEQKKALQELARQQQQAEAAARQREGLRVRDEQRQAAQEEAHKRMQEVRALHPDFPYDTFAEQTFHERWRELHPDIELIPQFRIGTFRVDFCHEQTKVVVELNGGIHRLRRVQNTDAPRHRLIGSLGWHVLPFTNDEINVYLDVCVQEVYACIMERLGQVG